MGEGFTLLLHVQALVDGNVAAFIRLKTEGGRFGQAFAYDNMTAPFSDAIQIIVCDQAPHAPRASSRIGQIA